MKKLMVGVLLVVTGCSGSTTTTSSAPLDSGSTSTTVLATTTEPPATEPSTPETTVSTDQSIEVAIPAQALDLAGTLRLPIAEAPAPAVVLIHGSGPQSRDSRLGGQ